MFYSGLRFTVGRVTLTLQRQIHKVQTTAERYSLSSSPFPPTPAGPRFRRVAACIVRDTQQDLSRGAISSFIRHRPSIVQTASSRYAERRPRSLRSRSFSNFRFR